MQLGNIGADGVRFRLFFGILLFLFAIGMMSLMTVAGIPLVMRVTVFLPTWLAMLCLFQARTSTCVFLAARGAVSTPEGVRKVEDNDWQQTMTKRSARIHVSALMAGVLFTLVLLVTSILIPWRVAFSGTNG